MKSKKKILIVDDLKEFTGLIRVFLSGEFDVITAYDGLHALNILRDGYKPDAIITDLIMPRLDGYQLIEQLKSEPKFSKIPVIVLTAVDKGSAKKSLKEESVSGLVCKPFVSCELNKELVPLLKQVTHYQCAS